MDISTLPFSEKKNILRNILTVSEALVEFTKVNGEHRVMPCTMDPSRFPPLPVTENKMPPKVNDSVLRVFCTDKHEWRSFRIDSVISVTEVGK